MDLGTPLRQAILDGAAEVATPALVSTLSICIVFVPIFLLSGVGGFLFSPLALAVVFAMLASYFLSRTLVPTMGLYLLGSEAHAREENWFEAGFRRLSSAYEGLLDWCLEHRRMALAAFLGFALASMA